MYDRMAVTNLLCPQYSTIVALEDCSANILELLCDKNFYRASSVPIFPIFPIFSQSSYISLYSLQMPYNPCNCIIFKI